MFSRQTAGRFDKDKTSELGPGAYDLPTTLDLSTTHTMNGPERWQDSSNEAAELGPGCYDPKFDERNSEPSGGISGSMTSASLAPVCVSRGAAKENRAPSYRRTTLSGTSPRASTREKTGTDTVSKEIGLAGANVEHRKLFSQIEQAQEDIRQRERENKKLHQLVAVKDKKVDELHKKVEELMADRREAHQRTAEAENERDAKRKQFHEKEQELTVLRRKEDQLRRGFEERLKQMERKEEEYKFNVGEMQRLRKVIEDLQERVARADAEAEQGGTDLARERNSKDELQRRLAELEHELNSVKALHAAQATSLHEAEDIRQELEARAKIAEELRAEVEARASKADVALEARTHELQMARDKANGLEEEQSSSCAILKERCEQAEAQIVSLSQELKNEHERSECFERRVAQLEQASAAAADLSKQQEEQRRAEREQLDLDARVRRAELEAQNAQEKVRCWKEWADQQELRELTMETQRLDELKRVREDVTRQVEEARRETVEENKMLQQKIRELESGDEAAADRVRLEEDLREQASQASEALKEQEFVRAKLEMRVSSLQAALDDKQQELDHSIEQYEEQRQALVAQESHADAERSLVADELADERAQREKRTQLLQEEHKAAMAAQLKEFEFSRNTEREAMAAQVKSLEEKLGRLGERCKADHWQLLVQGSTHQHVMESHKAVWVQACIVSAKLRHHMSLSDYREDDRCKQERAIEELTEENEDLLRQNQNFLASLQSAQQELQDSMLETQQLRDMEAEYMRNIEESGQRLVELGGHANQKQKIKHLSDVKAQRDKAQKELQHTKQQLMQAEAQLRTVQFWDTFQSTSCETAGSKGSRTSSSSKQPATPGRAPRTPAKGDRDPLVPVFSEISVRREHAMHADQVRHVKAHRRAAERAVADHQHLYAMVEQVLFLGSQTHCDADGLGMLVSTAVTTGAAAADRNGESIADPAMSGDLLQRLRKLGGALSKGNGGGGVDFVVDSARQPPSDDMVLARETDEPSTPQAQIHAQPSTPEPEDEASLPRAPGPAELVGPFAATTS